MSKIRLDVTYEEDTYSAGEFEPRELQSVIDLFLEYELIDPVGNSIRLSRVYLLVNDERTPFRVELS